MASPVLNRALHPSRASFDYGPIHVVVLEASSPLTSLARVIIPWLKSDLASPSTRLASWLIGVVHHPPYSRGNEDSDMHGDQIFVRERLLPLLEGAGLDLLLSGHSHTYERSLLVHNHHGKRSSWNATAHLVDGRNGDPDGDGPYVKPTGLQPSSGFVAVVTGSSAKLSVPSGLDYPLHRMFDTHKHGLQECGSLLVDVTSDVLDGRFVRDDGVVRDHFQIRKQG